MKARNFFVLVLAGVLLCFSILVGLVSWADPFFVVGGIQEGETAVFDNQRYEMAGLIRHQDYAAVVMGTSLAANYRASWFTQELGVDTLKITFPDGWISEFDTALRLAFDTHQGLDQVFFGLDPNILIRPDSQRTVELPQYLYNSNPLDDVEYLLNADTYQRMARGWLQGQAQAGVPLDEAYIWDGAYTFSKASALAGYARPEISQTQLPEDAYLAAAEENLSVVRSWAQTHPDTQFTIWFAPYSILYWDKMIREGSEQAVLAAVEYAAGELMQLDNVTVCCYLDDFDTITNLDNYTDHIHCSGQVTAALAEKMMAGEGALTPENYRARLDELESFVLQYDYESIFA